MPFDTLGCSSATAQPLVWVSFIFFFRIHAASGIKYPLQPSSSPEAGIELRIGAIVKPVIKIARSIRLGLVGNSIPYVLLNALRVKSGLVISIAVSP